MIKRNRFRILTGLVIATSTFYVAYRYESNQITYDKEIQSIPVVETVEYEDAHYFKDKDCPVETIQPNSVIEVSSTIEIQCKTDRPLWNPNDITEVSNISYDALYRMLEGYPIQAITQDFIEAEEEYHINALFLAGLVSQESGYGRSARANNGSNNLTGHAVYSNISRGSYFESWGHCVQATASLLANNYVKPGQQYYNGVSIWSINVKYSAHNKWARDINTIINGFKNKIM